MKTRVANISAIQGCRRSRLPKFSDEWISYIKYVIHRVHRNTISNENPLNKICLLISCRGTTDYVGINQYSSILVAPVVNQDYSVYIGFDNGLTYIRNTSWPKTGIPLYSVIDQSPEIELNSYSEDDYDFNVHNKLNFGR